IKLIKKSGNDQDNENIENPNKNNINENNESQKEEAVENKEIDYENKKERRYIRKRTRIAIITPIIFVGIVIFLEIMFHASSFRGNSVFIPIVSGVVLLFALIFFPLRWYSSYDDEEPENEENETENETKETNSTEENTEIYDENENIQYEDEQRKKRHLITDEKWKEFHLPYIEGNTFDDYSKIGNSLFIDIANWESQTLIKELEMFDPSLKNNMYYKHKVETFMKINDRDYRYPRVSGDDFLKPEEILALKIDKKIEIENKENEEDEVNG
ncbi:MAG: hypothetical protein ACP5L4_06435, partial [Thermoplasmata archaeon]